MMRLPQTDRQLAWWKWDEPPQVLSSEGYAHDQLHHNRKVRRDGARAGMARAGMGQGLG